MPTSSSSCLIVAVAALIGRVRALHLAGLVLAVAGAALWPTFAAGATLKIAALSPEGSVWMNLLRAGGESVAAATEGRVAFKFYPGGVMGDDKAVLRKMRVGQLHGAVMTAGALVQVYPDIALYNLPMLFRSGDEADYVRERLDARLMAGLEERGFVAFGFAEVGFAYAMSQNPVTSVADAGKQRGLDAGQRPGLGAGAAGVRGDAHSLAHRRCARRLADRPDRLHCRAAGGCHRLAMAHPRDPCAGSAPALHLRPAGHRQTPL